MFDAMRDYAVGSVWCSPDQDTQAILKAQKISKRIGERVSFTYMGRSFKLPSSGSYYHVYSIGQINPRFLGLIASSPDWAIGGWMKFSDAVNAKPIFCDIYTDSGVHLPLHKSYYQLTSDRALIFCVEAVGEVAADLREEQPYLRLYSNAFYQSSEGAGLSTNTRMVGMRILSAGDIVAVANTANQWRNLPGAVFCFINGFMREEASSLTLTIGDVVEIIHDTSVREVVDFDVSELYTFQSTLDACYKYLLHRPKGGSEIDYLDDIDLYVVSGDGAGSKGAYLHRNSLKTHRMLTHRDYSVSVDHYGTVAGKIASVIPGSDIRTFKIRMFIRDSGLKREMVQDALRTFELYRLSDERIVGAMTGVDASMPLWTADNLEQSAMAELFRVPYENIDIGLIQRAFGYNAISKRVGDMPLRGVPHGAYKFFILPAGLTGNSTIFEYDADGVLLGYQYNDYAYNYVSTHETCEMIEVVAGRGTLEPSVQYGTGPFTIPTDVSYRIYIDYLIDGQPSGEWRDVTKTSDYSYLDGVITWLTDESDFILMVRTDHSFLLYDLDITPIAGTVYFDLSEVSGGVHRTLPIPLGDLDIWLNGKSCIRDLDLIVDFPRVYVVNKDYLVQPAGSTAQKLTIRYTGFSDTDGDRFVSPVKEDKGFIVHEVLSDNNRYNLRDDKVLRITVKGRLKHRDQLIFSEEHDGVSVINEINGLPYSVKDVIVPLKSLTLDETYALRDRALVIDALVADYMTIKLPEPERNAVSAMYNRHRLVSPFFSHLINDIISGQFDLTSIQKELTDQDVLELCSAYEYLLAFDPINEKNKIDHRFVVTHPHQLDTMVTLEVYAYLFIKRVVKLYGRNLIDLANHVSVNTGG